MIIHRFAMESIHWEWWLGKCSNRAHDLGWEKRFGILRIAALPPVWRRWKSRLGLIEQVSGFQSADVQYADTCAREAACAGRIKMPGTPIMKAPIPANEHERLQALRRYDVLDTAPEQDFDDL